MSASVESLPGTALPDPVDLASFLDSAGYVVEEFTPEESALLSRHFTNLDLPVFAVVNLPEVVKGALFARYSRSDKSLRRLFLDEFADSAGASQEASDLSEEGVGGERAASLYTKVFGEYGDDSVAQLGGVHVACEQVSNLLTKVLERPRLASFLEQSTRYVPYDTLVTTSRGEHYRYHLDASLSSTPLGQEVDDALRDAFATYSSSYEAMIEHYSAQHPRGSDSEAVWRSAVRAKALDSVRGMLPAATRSNVGIYASGQAYEALVLRLRAHPLLEAQAFGQLLLTELRKVIPSFLTRVDRPDRGLAWSEYLQSARDRSRDAAPRALTAGSRRDVELVEFDPDGEAHVLAALLYPQCDASLVDLRSAMLGLSSEERSSLLAELVGERSNRRHRPGRGFEATTYTFDVLADYGAFRDLQRHRLLTVDWQALTPAHGYVVPEATVAAGVASEFRRVMDRLADVYERLVAAGASDAASYVVPLAYRIRFLLSMNAREAMHVLELRTAPAGHPSYRRVCQEMHRLIAEQHPGIAASMVFVDHSDPEGERLERLESERRSEQRRLQG